MPVRELMHMVDDSQLKLNYHADLVVKQCLKRLIRDTVADHLNSYLACILDDLNALKN